MDNTLVTSYNWEMIFFFFLDFFKIHQHWSLCVSWSDSRNQGFLTTVLLDFLLRKGPHHPLKDSITRMTGELSLLNGLRWDILPCDDATPWWSKHVGLMNWACGCQPIHLCDPMFTRACTSMTEEGVCLHHAYVGMTRESYWVLLIRPLPSWKITWCPMVFQQIEFLGFQSNAFLSKGWNCTSKGEDL